MHAANKMKDPHPELLGYLLNVFYMFFIRIWYNENNQLEAIWVKCKNYNKENCFTIKTNLSINLSLLLLLTLCLRMFDLHGFMSTARKSSLNFKNCFLLGCVMFHGIILQYAHSCMDIRPKVTSRLEEKTDMIFYVIFMHTIYRTVQQYLTRKQCWCQAFDKKIISKGPCIPWSYDLL